MTEIKSRYSRKFKDRQWTLGCSKIHEKFTLLFPNDVYPKELNGGWWTEYNLRMNIRPYPPDYAQWILVGMKSIHDNSKEDRKFKFYYTELDNNIYKLTNCRWDTINYRGSYIDKTLNDNEVIVGIQSIHQDFGPYQDRVWALGICYLGNAISAH